MSLKPKICIALSLLIGCVSCQKTSIQQFTKIAFGTYYSITYIGEENEQLPSKVDSVLATINQNFSIFDTTSLVSRINRNEQSSLNSDFVYLFNLSKQISEKTNGAFDITAGPLVNMWGFGKNGEQVPPKKGQIDSLLTFVGFHKVRIENNQLLKEDARIALDFNAIAKGYAVDKISKLLADAGYSNYIVDIGGEVVSRGNKGKNISWRVGIQIPTESKDGIIESDYTFELGDRAIATSGNYRNYKEENGIRYSHIINPQTGYSEKSSLLSVSVIANDCATADAYATAFMVLGIEKSMQILSQNSTIAAHFIYYENGNFRYKQTVNFPKSTF